MIDEQVDFVVGPLMKNSIDELQNLQQESANPIPMLALNFPDQVIAEDTFCYVTLSPEQEAEQAAIHLAQSGAEYPLVIAPNGTYGKRMAQAFTDAWNEQQTTKTATAFFSSKNQLQLAVNSVFGLQDSQRRIAPDE